jgi:hypothetical protein
VRLSGPARRGRKVFDVQIALHGVQHPYTLKVRPARGGPPAVGAVA